MVRGVSAATALETALPGIALPSRVATPGLSPALRTRRRGAPAAAPAEDDGAAGRVTRCEGMVLAGFFVDTDADAGAEVAAAPAADERARTLVAARGGTADGRRTGDEVFSDPEPLADDAPRALMAALGVPAVAGRAEARARTPVAVAVAVDVSVGAVAELVRACRVSAAGRVEGRGANGVRLARGPALGLSAVSSPVPARFPAAVLDAGFPSGLLVTPATAFESASGVLRDPWSVLAGAC